MEDNGQANHYPQGSHAPNDSVLSVGSSKTEEAERIEQLEDEVKQLAEKANTASQRYADYENEIRVLEAKLRQEQRKNSAPTLDTTAATAQTVQRPGISRFGSFMGTRKISGNQAEGPTESTGTREKELEEQLVKERVMRIAAEKKVKEVSAEIEDLSATLFQQANEMVATERKQNSELTEKLQALEQQQLNQHSPRAVEGTGSGSDSETLRRENVRLKEKVQSLEQREADRKKRVERLEAASKRIDRVRTMLQPP